MDETSESLLSKLQAVEREFGRPGRHGRNTPRTLDLDLLTFGLERRESERLILPHPRAHERAFVLAPLNEIAPQLILPGQQKTVRELLQDLGGTAARLVHRRQ
jgi:2-amino-4-hydroxy-6-hydroxymethyldihydropteridine diphosphokinase